MTDKTEHNPHGIKIVSKEEKAWTDILERAEEDIDNADRMTAMNIAIIQLAKDKIKEAKKRKA